MTAAALALLTTTAADAKDNHVTLARQGAWTAYYTIGDRGSPVCGMYAMGQDKTMFLKYIDGRLMAHFYKNSWRVKSGTTMNVTISFDRSAPLPGTGTANWSENTRSSFLEVGIKQGEESGFLDSIADADRLTIGFPDGDEVDWNINMAGSRTVSQALRRCAYVVDKREAEATQPTQPAPVQPKPTTSEMLFAIPPNVSGGHMNVRNGPGTNHGLLGAIPAGQTVRASRCVRRDDGIAGADWCLVTWNGLTGWVSQVGLMPVTPHPTQPVARSALSKDDGGI